ncbi:hypothetical protein ACHAXR_008294 [Thalassiosira sp. AJA248-18]
MISSYNDLNQSSRLDLDWDPDEEEDDDFGESNTSHCLKPVVEDQSYSSDEESRDSSRASFSRTSSVEDSPFVLETVSDNSSEGLEPSHDKAWDRGSSGGGGGGEQRRQQHHQEQSSHYEMDGSDGRHRRKDMHREGTHSTLETSPSSSRNSNVAKRKLVKIKVWNHGESSLAESSVVTVAMDMPASQEIGNMVHDLSLGVGQKIQLQQLLQKWEAGRNIDGEEKNVNISWQPHQPRTKEEEEESWQPPLRISKGEGGGQARTNRHADNQGSQPQSMPVVESSSSAHSSIPKLEASRPKLEASRPKLEATKSRTIQTTDEEKKTEATTTSSETMPTPVKGLEPFTIPSILSSTVIKRTPTEKVGMAFRKANGTVVIEKIVPGSAFDGTALRPGYECLCINGHRLRSARRAAEIVRESGSSLTLMASNAPRPPGTMYTMISLDNHSMSMSSGREYAVGMYFKMKHGLVQLVKVDADSPIGSTSMKAGDFVLGINGSVVGTISKAVEILSESNDDLVPILYFNMRQLRVSLVDKVIGDLWKKEWSEGYDECVVLQPGSPSSNPLTLRFKEEGMCELLDPLRGFREKSSEVPPDHPLNSVVETLNHGIICVLSAIREGVELATHSRGGGGASKGSPNGSSKGSSKSTSDVRNGEKTSDNGSSSIVEELAKLSEMYKEGLLSKDDFEAIKSKLLKS